MPSGEFYLIEDNKQAKCYLCTKQARYKSGFDHYLCGDPQCSQDYVEGYMDQHEYRYDYEVEQDE